MTRHLITCLPKLGLTDVPKVCSHKRIQAESPMDSKRHDWHFELVFVASGMQYRATNGFNYPLTGGQALLIQPGWNHSTGIMPHGTGHVFWMHINTNEQDFLGLPKDESRALIHALRNRTPLLHPGMQLQQAFEYVLRHAHSKASHLIRTKIRHALLDIILNIINAPEHNPQPDPVLSIFNYKELLDQPAMLAHRAGISLSRLRSKCKELTGMSLGDYLLHLRVQFAMERLIHQTHKSITEIALDLGFSSSQYFATVFKRYTALSPRQFRSDTDTAEGKRRLRKLGLI